MNKTEREQIIEMSKSVSVLTNYRERVSENKLEIFVDHIDWNIFSEECGIDMEKLKEEVKNMILNAIDDKINKTYLDVKRTLVLGDEELKTRKKKK